MKEKNSSSVPLPEQAAYEELQAYTLGLRDERFVHQHVVDAWMAQHADEWTKPIGLTFALVGLYLHLERGFSGRQVQRVHMALGRRKRTWPSLALPKDRGSVTAADVIAAAPGSERDRAIDVWCRSVWDSFRESRLTIINLLQH
jgi:Family of unknown function (DUF5946)